MLSPRRSPAPWTVEDLDTCYLVRDHDGQQLAYVYYEEESGRRSAAKCSRSGKTVSQRRIGDGTGRMAANP